MFRQNKKDTKKKSFAEKLEQRRSERSASEVGARLRQLAYWADDKIQQGIAIELIDQHGHNSSVINAQGQMLRSPIFKSVVRDHHEISHALMRAPALDVNLREIHGMNILMFAMQEYKPDHELIQYLLKRTDLDFTTKTYDRGSHLFSSDIRSKHRCRGASALYFATTSAELFQYIPALLDLVGDEVNDYVECKEWGRSASYKVQRSPLTNLVRALAEKNNNRPLLLQCITRIANTVSVNLGSKPKPQPRDEALYIAAKAGDRQVVEILLTAGANKEWRDEKGLTAATVAKYSGHADVATYILNYASSPAQPEPAPAYVAPPSDAPQPEASAPPLQDLEKNEPQCSPTATRMKF